ncbi:hypothetical protein DIKCMJMK_04167 [Shewanella oneidensis]|nr:hypothetical protein [Shewanella oneidensis]
MDINLEYSLHDTQFFWQALSIRYHHAQRLKQLQRELAGFEQIKKFTLLPEAFSMEAGLITPTLKQRCKMIYHKYAHEINAMYNN